MPPEKTDNEKTFTIVDRRISQKSEAEKEKLLQEEKAGVQKQEAPATLIQGEPKAAQAPPPLEVNFSSFMLSLATSALIQIGDMADPATNKQEKDLTSAKQTIDIIIMLKEKTAGNLSLEEQRLVESLLYDLRLRFVRQSKTA